MKNKNDYQYLLKVYRETKKDESNFIETQSVHWEKYNKEYKKFDNIENLINFRKDQVLSAGLDDAINLAIIFHQHQPYYKDSLEPSIISPF